MALRFDMVAASGTMQDLLSWVSVLSRMPTAVLLTGETGTGKELLARALHDNSGREGLFVAVNCGAIPEALFEAELFGHVKGAFTGATDSVAGLIESADRGTLFLDEIGEMPLRQQAGLLRVLDNRGVRRVGARIERQISVRVIAATNRTLPAEIAAGRFREDLYYRLAGAVRHIPPLRERPADIDAIAEHWLECRMAAGFRLPATITSAAKRALQSYHWPGNVRELLSVLERSTYEVLVRGESSLSDTAIAAALSNESWSPEQHSAEEERRRRALSALRVSEWRVRDAAKRLGVSRSTLHRWIGPTGWRNQKS